jgi:phage recombination protein Bet
MSEENKEALPVGNKQQGLLARFGSRYGVEGRKIYNCLKATAFSTKVGGKPATNEQMMALLIVADQYKLNPFTKEVFAFPDKNNGIVPVVGVDGWSRIINEHPEFDGMDTETSADGESCTCTIYRKDRTHPIKVTEYLAECKRNTQPWGSHPRRILRHKTIIQCARLAFGFAGIYDQDEAERIVENITDSVEISKPEMAMPEPIIDEPEEATIIEDSEPEPTGAKPTVEEGELPL